ncbi:hypothetical protein ACE1MS_22835 (plasmid) [Lysinibacillus sp. fkY74-1]|nr:hypothetical protein [Lysinibacillus fusiformis]SCX63535.1 hypothetical protein SAMN02787108_03274 [Lysinibacillus fusiformis]SDB46396.1 hypothetical protein SAMN02787070_03469 [Lysinibacillus fusiformis]SFI73639.1 hypothetical protein SAMN02787080_03488 [Lysinibacillus fusiformis]SFT15996.1 hypothetical protein SAMN02787099_03189 [Lysinibacillus fusiformis]
MKKIMSNKFHLFVGGLITSLIIFLISPNNYVTILSIITGLFCLVGSILLATTKSIELETDSKLNIFISSIFSLYIFVIIGFLSELTVYFLTMLLIIFSSIGTWVVFLIIFIYLICLYFAVNKKSFKTELILVFNLFNISFILLVWWSDELTKTVFNIIIVYSVFLTLSLTSLLFNRFPEKTKEYIESNQKGYAQAATLLSIIFTVILFTDTIYDSSKSDVKLNETEETQKVTNVAASNKQTKDCKKAKYELICYFTNDNIKSIKEAKLFTDKIIKHSQFSILSTIVGVAAYLIYWTVGSIRRNVKGEKGEY